MTRACARTYMFTSLSTPTRLADGFGSKVNPIMCGFIYETTHPQINSPHKIGSPAS